MNIREASGDNGKNETEKRINGKDGEAGRSGLNESNGGGDGGNRQGIKSRICRECYRCRAWLVQEGGDRAIWRVHSRLHSPLAHASSIGCPISRQIETIRATRLRRNVDALHVVGTELLPCSLFNLNLSAESTASVSNAHCCHCKSHSSICVLRAFAPNLIALFVNDRYTVYRRYLLLAEHFYSQFCPCSRSLVEKEPATVVTTTSPAASAFA